MEMSLQGAKLLLVVQNAGRAWTSLYKAKQRSKLVALACKPTDPTTKSRPGRRIRSASLPSSFGSDVGHDLKEIQFSKYRMMYLVELLEYCCQ